METKILIIGYYGANNIGDEVLLDATINLLTTVYDSPKITVLTNDIEDTTKNREVEGVHRNNYLRIIKTIKNSHIVVGGGGSMLQNVTSNKSLIYYLTILRLAKLFGKKVALLGNGIGPIETKFYQTLTKKVLKKLDAIVLRDLDSYDFLRRFGFNNIYLGNDLVYTLEDQKVTIKIPRKILINLRKWHYDENFIATIEKFIKNLINNNFNVTLVSFQTDSDDLILKEIYNRINLPGLNYFHNTEYDKLIQEISSGELFIGMRLHGLIFSSISNTPFIGLSYDPKVSTFSKNVEQEFFDDLNNLTFNAIINTFEKVYSNIHDYEKKLQRNTNEIKKLGYVHRKALKLLK